MAKILRPHTTTTTIEQDIEKKIYDALKPQLKSNRLNKIGLFQDEYLSVLTGAENALLKKSFEKYDKSKSGCIKPEDLGNVIRMAGQNPTLAEEQQLIEDGRVFISEGSGMLMFNDIIPIVDKYWKNYENYIEELKGACLAFDKQDMGLMQLDDLKLILFKYGDQLDDDDLELFEKTCPVSDGKVIVDEFITMLSPLAPVGKKKKGSAKSAKKKPAKK